MALTITLPNGITVKADTPLEAASFTRQMMPAPAVQPPNKPASTTIEVPSGQMAISGLPPRTATAAPAAVLTLAFLHAIRQSGSVGADTEAIARALQVSKVKGIGPRASKVKEYLLSRGFDLEAVFQVTRNPDGGSFWTAGPRLDVAIDSVQEVIDAHND